MGARKDDASLRQEQTIVDDRLAVAESSGPEPSSLDSDLVSDQYLWHIRGEVVEPELWLKLCRMRAEDRVPKREDGTSRINPHVYSFWPWGHRVVVRREDPEDQTAGGIVVPDTAKDKRLAVGWVISVGQDICIEDLGRYASVCPMTSPLELVGCRVLFNRYTGHDLMFDSYSRRHWTGEYLVLPIGDVWGVVNNDWADIPVGDDSDDEG